MAKHRSRRLLTFISMAMFTTAIPVFGADASVVAALKNALDTNKSSEIRLHSLTTLPAAIQRYYTSSLSEPKMITRVFAEGDQPWESGCIRFNKSPSNHLNFYAQSGSLHFLFYDVGGINLTQVVDVFEISDSGALIRGFRARHSARSSGDWRNVSDFVNLRKLLREGESEVTGLDVVPHPSNSAVLDTSHH